MQVSNTFDFTPYRRVPPITARTELALGRALLDARPIGRSELIDQAAQRIAALLDTLEAMLPARTNPKWTATDEGSGFETGTQALWEVLRGRLTTWQGFEHPGLDAMIARGDGLARVLEAGRRKAERARACAEAMFVGAGLRIFRGCYDDQSADMGVLLRLVDDADLGAEIDALVGEEILPALVGCQRRYREMAAAGPRGSSSIDPELAAVHRELHRNIELYVIAVLGLLVADTDEAADSVRAALRPILVLRTQLSEGRWLPGEEEARVVDDLDEDAGLESVFDDGSVALAI